MRQAGVRMLAPKALGRALMQPLCPLPGALARTRSFAPPGVLPGRDQKVLRITSLAEAGRLYLHEPIRNGGVECVSATPPHHRRC